MMFKKNFVVCIKSGGKILREMGDVVKMPFGSEFSILAKNLNNRRAEFSLDIDGQDVLGGSKIIVDANSDVEIKRFIKNGNMDAGNAFRFIERTQKIEDGPRGVKIDDGIVRVEYWFEKEKPVENHVHTYHHHHNDYWPYFYSEQHYRSTGSGMIRGMSTQGGQIFAQNAGSASIASTAPPLGGAANSALSTDDGSAKSVETESPTTSDVQVNDVGITVPGSQVEQKFMTVYGFDAESVSEVIVLRLVGTIGNIQVKELVTVKSKQKCVTCSHMNKIQAKFCSECGTALEIL